ncbi:MAG: hypothetical protein QOH56_4255 [Pseudonocardiales bacterium]|jgi:parallel beta-helix repeat protein|nr:hypothetical protein [Pseudonocardiales bacterium]
MMLRRCFTATACAAAVIAAIGFAIPPATAAVSTILVGTANCSDLGTGTAAQPYCTLAKAASKATSGQTVEVAAGTYAGGATVANSGVAGAPITFKPAAGAAVTVSGGTNGFRINAKSYVTVQGFSITGTSSYGIAVLDSNNITLSGNVVTHAGDVNAVPPLIAYGIYLSGTTNSLVSGNRADSNSHSGIFVGAGTANVTVRGNEASLNASLAAGPPAVGRQATGITVIGPGNSIVGNVVHDNEDSGIQVYPVSNTPTGGITRGGDNTLVAGNVSYNNGDHGIDNRDVNGGRIIGNTIYRNCTSGINIEGVSLGYLVENNIAVDNAVLPAYQGIACTRRTGNIGVWDSSTATVDFNLVQLSTAGNLYVYHGVSYSSISALHAATGQESHGLQANPKFTDAAGWNLALAAGSPAIDSADSAASGQPGSDVLGHTRIDDPATDPNSGSGPRSFDDRGAYEFSPTVAAPPGGSLHPVLPARILDTRSGNGAVRGAVPAGATRVLQVSGRGGVPTNDVIAVVMNVTVTAPRGSGYVTVYPSGATPPASSNLNFVAGQTVPNLVTVALGLGGQITLRNGSSGTVQLIADVSGWFGTPATSAGPSGRYNATGPFRLLDTRASKPIAGGQTVELQVTGRSGNAASVPATGVSAVALNVTVTAPTTGGYVTVFPSGVSLPNTSTLNYVPKLTRANRTIVGVGIGGKVSIFNSSGATQVIIDVMGWFTDTSSGGTGATFVPLATPQRLLDSRTGSPWTAASARTFAVAGSAGVAAMTSAFPPKAVLANVTVTRPSTSGYLTVYPGGTRPGTSDLNWTKGQTVPNLTVAGLSPGGALTIFNSNGQVDVILDVFGWFA